MEWRCEWCGKPHEEDDPPCDNCGHGSFEQAVVPRTDLSEGEGPDETIVWVCPECGRTHTKHTPPCSRCGNRKLVREAQRVDESELTAPSYLDLVTPKYVAGLVVVLGLAAVFVLGVTGIVYIPGLSPGLPPLSDVPGDAATAGERNLTAVEDAYLDALNDRRSAAGVGTLSRNDRLDDVAEWANQRAVKAEYGDGQPPDRGTIRDALSGTCDGARGLVVTLEAGEGIDAADSDAGLAGALVERRVTNGEFAPADRGIAGLDVHVAPDGTTYLTQFVC